MNVIIKASLTGQVPLISFATTTAAEYLNRITVITSNWILFIILQL